MSKHHDGGGLPPAIREANRRRNLVATYKEALLVDSSDAKEVSDYMSHFNKSVSKYEKEFQIELDKYPVTVGKHYKKLVPKQVSHKSFMQRYFFRCCNEQRILNELDQLAQLQQQQQKAASHQSQSSTTVTAAAGPHSSQNSINEDSDNSFSSFNHSAGTNDNSLQLPKRTLGSRRASYRPGGDHDGEQQHPVEASQPQQGGDDTEQRGVQRAGSDRFASVSRVGSRPMTAVRRGSSDRNLSKAALAAFQAPGRSSSSSNTSSGGPLLSQSQQQRQQKQAKPLSAQTGASQTPMPPSVLKKPKFSGRAKLDASDDNSSIGGGVAVGGGGVLRGHRSSAPEFPVGKVAMGTQPPRSSSATYHEKASVRFRGVPEFDPMTRPGWESEESHIGSAIAAPPTPFHRQESGVTAATVTATIPSMNNKNAPPTPFQRQESVGLTTTTMPSLNKNKNKNASSTSSNTSGASGSGSGGRFMMRDIPSPPIKPERPIKTNIIKGVLKPSIHVDPKQPPTEAARPGWAVRDRPARAPGAPPKPKRQVSVEVHSETSSHRASFSSRSSVSTNFDSDMELTEYADEDYEDREKDDDDGGGDNTISLNDEADAPPLALTNLCRDNSGMSVSSVASIQDTMKMWGAAMKRESDRSSHTNGEPIDERTSNGDSGGGGGGSLLSDDEGDDDEDANDGAIPREDELVPPRPPGFGSSRGKDSLRPVRHRNPSITSTDEEEGGDETERSIDEAGGDDNNGQPVAWRVALGKKNSQRRLSYSDTDDDSVPGKTDTTSGPPKAWQTALKRKSHDYDGGGSKSSLFDGSEHNGNETEVPAGRQNLSPKRRVSDDSDGPSTVGRPVRCSPRAPERQQSQESVDSYDGDFDQDDDDDDESNMPPLEALTRSDASQASQASQGTSIDESSRASTDEKSSRASTDESESVGKQPRENSSTKTPSGLDAYLKAGSKQQHKNNNNNTETLSQGGGSESGGSVSERLRKWGSQHKSSTGPISPTSKPITAKVAIAGGGSFKDRLKKYGSSSAPPRTGSNDSMRSSASGVSIGGASASSYTPTGSLHYQLAVRSVNQVESWRGMSETYTKPIEPSTMSIEEVRGYRDFNEVFDLSKMEDDIQIALAKYPDTVAIQYKNLVPSELSRDDFWIRYFFRCDEKRVLLALRRNDSSSGGSSRPPDVVELGGEDHTSTVSSSTGKNWRSNNRGQGGHRRVKSPPRPAGSAYDELDDISTHTAETSTSVKERLRMYASKTNMTDHDASLTTSEFLLSPANKKSFSKNNSWNKNTSHASLSSSPTATHSPWGSVKLRKSVNLEKAGPGAPMVHNIDEKLQQQHQQQQDGEGPVIGDGDDDKSTATTGATSTTSTGTTTNATADGILKISPRRPSRASITQDAAWIKAAAAVKEEMDDNAE